MSERAFPSASWLFDEQLPISPGDVGDGYMRFVVPRLLWGKGGGAGGGCLGEEKEGEGGGRGEGRGKKMAG
jgi:hypothetical protein